MDFFRQHCKKKRLENDDLTGFSTWLNNLILIHLSQYQDTNDLQIMGIDQVDPDAVEHLAGNMTTEDYSRRQSLRRTALAEQQKPHPLLQ